MSYYSCAMYSSMRSTQVDMSYALDKNVGQRVRRRPLPYPHTAFSAGDKRKTVVIFKLFIFCFVFFSLLLLKSLYLPLEVSRKKCDHVLYLGQGCQLTSLVRLIGGRLICEYIHHVIKS